MDFPLIGSLGALHLDIETLEPPVGSMAHLSNVSKPHRPVAMRCT